MLLTIVKSFELFVIIIGVTGSSFFFQQAPQVEKESGAEGGEYIGDFQDHFGQFY